MNVKKNGQLEMRVLWVSASCMIVLVALAVWGGYKGLYSIGVMLAICSAIPMFWQVGFVTWLFTHKPVE